MVETLRFGRPDVVPLVPGSGRKSTLAAWHSQGLPADVKNYNEYAYRLAGGTRPWPGGGEGFHVNERMIPQFEEQILEERGDTRVVQDWKGNVCEISSEYGVEYLRNAIDFVTRRWIRCPVETRADWEAMKARYDASTPGRLPADAAALAARLRDRDWPVQITFSGPFWQLREWLGFENLCMLLHDDPPWVREMIGFWSDYMSALLERMLAVFQPDLVRFGEDMAYKQFSMISPAMAREFLLPVWTRWGRILRARGVPLYDIDSDGYVGELIPLWIEAGVNVCDPMEVAAGNDLIAFRRQFGRKMAFQGGVDKRAMARGGAALEAEIARLQPLVDDGGFIPSCDHGVPADVSWPNYVRYVELLARATGWL
jgi:uroporphyrinogen decarboxylase